jgi:hypothetical protein
VEGGGWRVEGGGWRVEDGRRKREDGGGIYLLPSLVQLGNFFDMPPALLRNQAVASRHRKFVFQNSKN